MYTGGSNRLQIMKCLKMMNRFGFASGCFNLREGSFIITEEEDGYPREPVMEKRKNTCLCQESKFQS
jgi:hypothetical protein